jgi:hypothetical protein
MSGAARLSENTSLSSARGDLQVIVQHAFNHRAQIERPFQVALLIQGAR